MIYHFQEDDGEGLHTLGIYEGPTGLDPKELLKEFVKEQGEEQDPGYIDGCGSIEADELLAWLVNRYAMTEVVAQQYVIPYSYSPEDLK